MKYQVLIFSLFFIISCNQKYAVDEFEKDFLENRWIKNDIKRMSFSIEEANDYAIDLHLGHIYDFQFEEIPVLVTIFNGEQLVFQEEILIKMKDENGKDKGDCLGDICDLYIPISQKISLNKGNYTIQFENKFDHEYLPNILGIGLRVKK